MKLIKRPFGGYGIGDYLWFGFLVILSPILIPLYLTGRLAVRLFGEK